MGTVSTFRDLLEKIEASDEHPFIEWFEGDEKRSYSNKAFARLVAQATAKLSVDLANAPAGSWVGLSCANGPYWHVAFFALLASGHDVALVDAKIDRPELEQVISNCRMGGLVSSQDRSDCGLPCVMLDELVAGLSEGEPANVELPEASAWGRHVAFCTSGTTSSGKVAVHQADLLAASVNNLGQQWEPGFGDPHATVRLGGGTALGQRTLVGLPQHHVFGFIWDLGWASQGATMTLPKNPAISGIIDTIKQEGIVNFAHTPAIWKALLNVCRSRYGEVTKAALDDLLGEQFQIPNTGGANVDMDMRTSYTGADRLFITGMGMSEAGITLINFHVEDHIESEGRPLVGSTIEIAVLKGDGSVSPTGEGEMLLFRDEMFDGYMRDGELAPWERYDGRWFRTGDLVRIDEDGYLYFLGRIKNVIVTDTGENIAAEELERHFDLLEQRVEQYCAIELDQRPCLIVYAGDRLASEQREALAAELKELNAKLVVHKRIHKVIFTPDRMPVTAKGDIRKIDLDKDALRDQETYVLKR